MEAPPPRVLTAERQRGGELHVQLRLSDGRTALAIVPAGDFTDEQLAELDRRLVDRLTPPGAVAR